MSMLEVKNLSKSFGSTEVLKDISFTVYKGEVWAIIGPSGSGKSTLLRCINQLEKASGGEINVCGKEMLVTNEKGKKVYASPSVLREIRLNIGLVFQNFNLFPQYSVLKNVTLAPDLQRPDKKKENKENALALLEQVGLSRKVDAYPYQLSGGQQQRVAIARALALQPKVLCFDEPTSALDPELTGEVLRVIKGLKSENITMIVVTHEMAFAKSVADVVLYMADGEIVESGTPEQVFGNPQQEKTKAFLQSTIESY